MNILDIDPDLAVVGDSNKNKLVSMRNVEPHHVPAIFDGQGGLAVDTILETQLLWFQALVASDDRPEEAAGNGEMILHSSRRVFRGPHLLVRCKHVTKLVNVCVRLTQARSPYMNFVDQEKKRLRWRGPRNRGRCHASPARFVSVSNSTTKNRKELPDPPEKLGGIDRL
jgi:hypothetical protein